jgi:hypothetical protein
MGHGDVEELLAKRGLQTDHVIIWRWVQRFACRSGLGCDLLFGLLTTRRRSMRPALALEPLRDYRAEPRNSRLFADQTWRAVAGAAIGEGVQCQPVRRVIRTAHDGSKTAIDAARPA